jgi:hypothetical protein
LSWVDRGSTRKWDAELGGQCKRTKKGDTRKFASNPTTLRVARARGTARSPPIKPLRGTYRRAIVEPYKVKPHQRQHPHNNSSASELQDRQPRIIPHRTPETRSPLRPTRKKLLCLRISRPNRGAKYRQHVARNVAVQRQCYLYVRPEPPLAAPCASSARHATKLTARAVILSSEDGSRIFTKYYNQPHQAPTHPSGAGTRPPTPSPLQGP